MTRVSQLRKALIVKTPIRKVWGVKPESGGGETLAIDLVEASQQLRVSERTMWRLVRDGKIPHKRVGKQYRFSPAVLQEWLAAGSEEREG